MHRSTVLLVFCVLPIASIASTDSIFTLDNGLGGNLIYPFVSPDFLVTSLLVAALTLARYREAVWLPPALFSSAVGLGFLMVMAGLNAPYTAAALVACVVLLSLYLVAGRSLNRGFSLVVVGAMGGLLGHYGAQSTEASESGLCMCGIGLRSCLEKIKRLPFSRWLLTPQPPLSGGLRNDDFLLSEAAPCQLPP